MEENSSNASALSPVSIISSHSSEMSAQENNDNDMKTSQMCVDDLDLSFSDENEAFSEMAHEEDVSGLPRKGGKKPVLSYIGIIAMAIMSSPKKKMLLSEIYQWISEKFLYFKQKDRSWRNSIRHNLSLNECFVKSGRSENGKGNYWTIHPANLEDFSKGDFHRRRARRRVRKSEDMQRHQTKYLTTTSIPGECMHATPNGYVPMSSKVLPTHVLTQMFGAENILTREELLSQYFSAVNPVGAPTVNHMTSSLASPVSDPATFTSSPFSDKLPLTVAYPHGYQLLSPPLAACRENGWHDLLVPL